MYLFLYLYKCNPFVVLLVMQLIENLVNLNNANTPMVILFFLPKQEKPIYIYILIRVFSLRDSKYDTQGSRWLL